MTAQTPAAEIEPTTVKRLPRQVLDNFRTGNLGSWPVVVALAIIVLYFSQVSSNFFTATTGVPARGVKVVRSVSVRPLSRLARFLAFFVSLTVIFSLPAAATVLRA